MKQVFLSTTTEFKEIDTLEPGTWINLVNPTQNESLEIANAFDIDIADLRAPLDAEEMSRITIEDEYTLIIVDVPVTEERNNRTYYVTIPLGIIITEETIITTCLEPLPVLDVFINRRLRNFYTFMRSRFIFQILYRKILEESLILSQVHADLVRFETAGDRYKKMCKLMPQVVLRAPLVYIASYLQMTPETLSRVRATTLID